MNIRSLSTTLRFFRPHRMRAAQVVALQVIAGFAENLGILALLPIIQGLIANEGTTNPVGVYLSWITTKLGLPADMRGYLLLVLIAALVKCAITYISLRAGHRLVVDVMTDMRLLLLRGLISLRWPAFARQKIGEIVGLQVTEMERFRPGIASVVTLATTCLHITFYLISSIIVSWQLTLLALGLGFLKVMILQPIRRSVYRLGKDYSAGINELSVGLVEGVSNIKPLRAMGADQGLFRRLETAVRDYGPTTDRLMRNNAWFSVSDELLTSIALVLVLLICSTVLSVELVQLAIVGVLISRILAQISYLQKAMHTIDGTGPIADQVEFALQQYKQQVDFSFGKRKIHLRREIRTEGVVLAYDDRTVLEDVSLTIPAGSFCALVGRSGGGKTTFVDCLLGLIMPVKGRLLVDGEDLAGADIAAWRSNIGYVPQDTVLFNDTVMANITLNRRGVTEGDVWRALVAAEAQDFVQALPEGLETSVGERGTALSGGQRQRLALARALVHNPSLLVLDEATSALDPVTEAEICQTLRKLAGKLTIIAVSHQPKVAETADMVVEIDNSGARVVSEKYQSFDYSRMPVA